MAGIWGAAEAGDLAEVQRLVGQDPGLLSARDSYEWTPLMRAASEGRVEVVRWLVDRGASLDEGPDRGESTALIWASSGGHYPVVRLLLERGADPTLANSYRCIPLTYASLYGHLEITRSLLDHPSAAATINYLAFRRRTALGWACARGNDAVARALLEKGADPTIADDDGRTPMAVAKLYGRVACIEALEVRCPLRPYPCRSLLNGPD
jgi:ankyrin repeat protein